MAEVESHFQDLENQEHAGRVGLWVFLGSEVLFFAALFALYAGYRSAYGEQFAEASHHSKIVIGTVNTYVLITSSLFVALALAAMRKDKPRHTIGWLSLTVVFGLAFMCLKALEYSEHFEEGIFPGAAYRLQAVPGSGGRMYFTLYYAMTGLHALHVFVGLGLLLWIIHRTHKGRYSAEQHEGLELVGLYWHFVDIVWIFLWPTFYLVH